MYIQLKTGNTISISAYEYFFVLKDEDIELFYEACVADNLGVYKDNPFSDLAHSGIIEVSNEADLDIQD